MADEVWHVGVALGSVVGELKKVDDIDGNQEFVVVPRTGPDTITCKFPASMKDAIGNYLFKTVRVSGKLHYGAGSPFPFVVDVAPDGLEEYPVKKQRRTFAELQGVFVGRERRIFDADAREYAPRDRRGAWSNFWRP